MTLVIFSSGGGLTPVLDYNFLTQQAADDTVMPGGVTFARSDKQTRYRWNASGLLASVATGVPCYQWDSDLAAQGLWIEPSVTQRLIQSDNLITSWSYFDTGYTSVANAGDPKGGSAAVTWTLGTGAGTHSHYQADTTAADGANKVLWYIVKPTTPAAISGIQLLMNSNSVNLQAVFRLDLAKQFGYVNAPATVWSAMSCGIRKVGNQGFYLVWLSGLTASALASIRSYLLDETGVTTFQDLTAPTFVFSNAGLHSGSLPVNPIDTTTAELANAADSVTFLKSAIDTTTGTFVLDHDAPSTSQLLSCAGTDILTAPSTGFSAPAVRRTLIAYNGSGSTIYDNGVLSSSGGVLDFSGGATIQIGATATSVPMHVRRVRWYSQDLSV